MDSIYKKAAKGFQLLFLVKIITRVVDFILNILVIRKIDPEVYGLTMHLSLLTNFIIFYTKNCLKNSYQRRLVKNEQVLLKSSQNLMIFGSFITIPLSLLFIFIWNYLYSGLNQQFYTSCILFGLGAALETYGEPFLVKSILQFDYSVQAKAESLSLFIKTIVLYILESNKSTFYSTLINFGISEVIRGLVFALISIYYRQLSDSMNYIPEQIKIKQNAQQPYYIHKKIKAIGLEFTILSFFKLLLQEIEKIFLINVKNDAFVNAEYTLISHLGSIIPRFIFQPLEEIAYNLFAKISQTNESTEEQVQQAKVKNASQLQKIITILLQLVIIIGSFAIVFGIPVSKDILHLLYGEKWSSHVSTVQTLQYFCVYLGIMGINGITEAFLLATISTNEMKIYKYIQGIITFVYISCCFLFTDMGAKGLVLANIFSMSLRILVNFGYIFDKISQRSFALFYQLLQKSTPSLLYTVFLMITFIFFQIQFDSLVQNYLNRIFIATVIASFFLVWFIKDYLNEFRYILQQKNKISINDEKQIGQDQEENQSFNSKNTLIE